MLAEFRTIVSWHTGTCVDVDGASQESGAKVQIYTCNGTVAQLWEKLPTDSGYFRLRVAASGQCMAVKGASQAEGALVVQNPCNFDFNQQWKQADSGAAGFPQLVARHSGKVLIMRSEALADRTPLIQVTYGGPGSDPLNSTAWQFR
ncbi:MAG: RICIN domain-containing protein [Umezawaea sp.]